MFSLHKNNSGFILLMSVLIVGAITTSIVLTSIQLGISHSKNSLTSIRIYQAKTLSDTCIEEALEVINNSTPYTGTDTVSLSTGMCTYTVVSAGGQNRNIFASSTIGEITRKTSVTIDSINPNINVTSWQEVSDF